MNAWKNQFRDAKAKYEELTRKADQVNEDRAKIADVLIKAQDKAEQLLEDARTQALEEKKKLEHSIEQEKEKLVDIKEDLKTLKSIVVDTLEKYESQLNEMIDEGETEEEAS
jgi:RNase adaptor protein for sRNA GlmZ degradation